MKTFKQHILEKLKVSAHTYTLFPKSIDELRKIIKDEISKNGNECSLNHIDVSNITDISYIFLGTPEFNGDISQWDVSKVTNMEGLFYESKFNRDISGWDVSSVRNMSKMFQYSTFNGDISDWDVSNVETMEWMFRYSKFNRNISNWDVSNVRNMEWMFLGSSMEKNPPKWYKQ